MFVWDKTKKIICWSLLGLCCTYSAVSNASVEHVVWNKNFINLSVPIGKEKLVEFCQESSPSTCQTIGFKASMPADLLESGQLRYIGANGALYLTAKKKFSNKLVQINLQNKDSNTVFLRLSASKDASDSRVEILVGGKTKNASTSDKSQSEDKSLGDIVRQVAQNLYAPKRLLTHPNWIYRVPMHAEHFIPIYEGGVVSAMPLASWRSGNYYVTAVLLRNVLQGQDVHLLHGLLRGSWIAASFFRLSPENPALLTHPQTLTDSTTLILVSSVPFSQALGGNSNAL